MKKRTTLRIGGTASFLLIIVVLAAMLLACEMPIADTRNDASGIEYRTDKGPIEDRFANLPSFSACYWKADTIGRTSFGPTNYWMRGFIILDEATLSSLEKDYDWTAVNIDFPKGIDPGITGKTDFTWYESKEFEATMFNGSFVGAMYLETTNAIIYFDVENL